MTYNDRIAEEAADWFGRLREQELSSADRKQFAQWLEESPVHVREYLGISQTWGALQSAKCWPEQTSEELFAAVRADTSDTIVSLKELLAPLPALRAKARRSRPISLAIAASVAALALSLAWYKFSTDRTVYSTDRGEQRSVVLPDGSVVQLNTLTKMVVHFNDGHRRIELPKGEAFFRVAHDATRPFDVETPYAVVRAVGTEFNVYNRTTGTRVAVIEGKVQVERRTASPNPSPRRGEGGAHSWEGEGPKPISLGPKQSVEVSAQPESATTAPAQVLPETQSPTAWMQRRIVFEGERLDKAAEEFNRYNKLQMQVADPQLAALRISGVFSADDPQALMKYLKEIQNVDIHRDAEGFLLQRAR